MLRCTAPTEHPYWGILKCSIWASHQYGTYPWDLNPQWTSKVMALHMVVMAKNPMFSSCCFLFYFIPIGKLYWILQPQSYFYPYCLSCVDLHMDSKRIRRHMNPAIPRIFNDPIWEPAYLSKISHWKCSACNFELKQTFSTRTIAYNQFLKRDDTMNKLQTFPDCFKFICLLRI